MSAAKTSAPDKPTPTKTRPGFLRSASSVRFGRLGPKAAGGSKATDGNDSRKNNDASMGSSEAPASRLSFGWSSGPGETGPVHRDGGRDSAGASSSRGGVDAPGAVGDGGNNGSGTGGVTAPGKVDGARTGSRRQCPLTSGGGETYEGHRSSSTSISGSIWRRPTVPFDRRPAPSTGGYAMPSENQGGGTAAQAAAQAAKMMYVPAYASSGGWMQEVVEQLEAGGQEESSDDASSSTPSPVLAPPLPADATSETSPPALPVTTTYDQEMKDKALLVMRKNGMGDGEKLPSRDASRERAAPPVTRTSPPAGDHHEETPPPGSNAAVVVVVRRRLTGTNSSAVDRQKLSTVSSRSRRRGSYGSLASLTASTSTSSRSQSVAAPSDADTDTGVETGDGGGRRAVRFSSVSPPEMGSAATAGSTPGQGQPAKAAVEASALPSNTGAETGGGRESGDEAQREREVRPATTQPEGAPASPAATGSKAAATPEAPSPNAPAEAAPLQGPPSGSLEPPPSGREILVPAAGRHPLPPALAAAEELLAPSRASTPPASKAAGVPDEVAAVTVVGGSTGEGVGSETLAVSSSGPKPGEIIETDGVDAMVVSPTGPASAGDTGVAPTGAEEIGAAKARPPLYAERNPPETAPSAPATALAAVDTTRGVIVSSNKATTVTPPAVPPTAESAATAAVEPPGPAPSAARPPAPHRHFPWKHPLASMHELLESCFAFVDATDGNPSLPEALRKEMKRNAIAAMRQAEVSTAATAVGYCCRCC